MEPGSRTWSFLVRIVGSRLAVQSPYELIGGRFYLYGLAAAGQAGVEKALTNLKNEIERDMKLMGCKSISDLGRHNLLFR